MCIRLIFLALVMTFAAPCFSAEMSPEELYVERSAEMGKRYGEQLESLMQGYEKAFLPEALSDLAIMESNHTWISGMIPEIDAMVEALVQEEVYSIGLFCDGLNCDTETRAEVFAEIPEQSLLQEFLQIRRELAVALEQCIYFLIEKYNEYAFVHDVVQFSSDRHLKLFNHLLGQWNAAVEKEQQLRERIAQMSCDC